MRTLRILALSPLLLVLGIGWQLWSASSLARQAIGWGFLSSSAWDPVAGNFGAWPFLYGTLLTTALALALAAPLGVAAAVFLAELAPRALRQPLNSMVSLLAAVPSVVYGLWGIFALVPWLGFGYASASLILAIMIVPYIVSLAREALAAVPRQQAEAAYALGATRWEVIGRVLLPAARSGIAGGVALAMGRALGETMAVTMVIGNRPAAGAALFGPGTTLASAIANEFTEATSPRYTAALVELGLVLFALTLLANAAARLLSHARARALG